MRFGYWRVVMLAVVLFSSIGTVQSALADAFGCVMPKEVLARDLNTGQPYLAPPIPWGHYAKDGHLDHFYGKHCGICGGNHKGLMGHGGKSCGKDGCGHCGKSGDGLFHHGGSGCDDPSCGLSSGHGHGRRIKNCGLCGGKGCGLCRSSQVGEPIHAIASEQAAPAKVVVTSPQGAPMASSQDCGMPGCKLGKGHHHGDPSMGELCGSCGGKGCGHCGGLGKLFAGHGGDKCGNCGGKGCQMCGSGGLKGKLSGLLHPHRGDIKYFVGAGGPVPLTPGYVPYIVTTRSPRDFLAFPPYTPDGF